MVERGSNMKKASTKMFVVLTAMAAVLVVSQFAPGTSAAARLDDPNEPEPEVAASACLDDPNEPEPEIAAAVWLDDPNEPEPERM